MNIRQCGAATIFHPNSNFVSNIEAQVLIIEVSKRWSQTFHCKSICELLANVENDELYDHIINDVIWALWRPKSPVNLMFVQQLVQGNNDKNIKARGNIPIVDRFKTYLCLQMHLCNSNNKNVFPNTFYGLHPCAFLVQLLSGECHRTLLMIGQHWFS